LHRTVFTRRFTYHEATMYSFEYTNICRQGCVSAYRIHCQPEG